MIRGRRVDGEVKSEGRAVILMRISIFNMSVAVKERDRNAICKPGVSMVTSRFELLAGLFVTTCSSFKFSRSTVDG
jgi:hypothetical protein